MKYILSYGGGINSSALFFYLLEKKRPIDLVIFSDTGEETPRTWDSINKLKEICSIKKIPFVIAKSNLGGLYEHYFSKKSVMSIMRKDCSGKFKISPIRKALRERYGKKEKFFMYIGIASEEFHRIRESGVKYITNVYPFVDDKINRRENLEILKRYDFKAYKSGCKGCLYTKRREWIKMIIENPEEFKRHLRLEENNSAYPRVLLNGSYPLRSLYDSFKNQKSLKSFEDTAPSCEVSGSCFL